MKRQRIFIALSFMCIITLADLARPTVAQASCPLALVGNGAATITIDWPSAAGTYFNLLGATAALISFKWLGTPGLSAFLTTLTISPTVLSGKWSLFLCGGHLIVSGSSVSAALPLPFMDGRCNQQADQTVAVYPDWKGGYYFYAVWQGIGSFAFRVTEQNLDDNPTKSTNYLIAHNLNVWLYREMDGSLLVTGIKADGKMYSFNIGSCGDMED